MQLKNNLIAVDTTGCPLYFDPVLGYNEMTGLDDSTKFNSTMERYINFVRRNGWKICEIQANIIERPDIMEYENP